MLSITCKCGKKYQLDEKYAGREVRCRSCREMLAVPQRLAAADLSVPPRPAGQEPASKSDATVASDEQPVKHVVNGGTSSAEAPHSSNWAHYSFIRPFAKGGMGKISIARDEPLKREVALKELLEAASANELCRRRFLDEAEITGQLEHPGVVPVHALGTDRQGRPFYVMRLVRGGTLKEVIDEYHRSPTVAALRALLRRFVMVCQTMAYAHNRGVIHRDLKPTNIMLGNFGETLVMDWGLAKPLAGGATPDSTVGDLAQALLPDRPEVTALGGIVGTPAYMSPEQASGGTAEIGPAWDIYSLGAILYQILTGQPAYSGASSAEVIEKVRSEPPPKPSVVDPCVSPPLEAICLKAMARQPGARYASTKALAADVQNWLDDEPTSVYRDPPITRVLRWAKRRQPLATGIAVGFSCLVVTLFVGSLLVQREQARTAAAQNLAEQYALQAADANQLAQENEEKAQRLADQLEKARAEAAEADQGVAKAKAEVDQLTEKNSQLKNALQADKTQADQLNSQLTETRAALSEAEARLAAATERATAAREQIASLERQLASAIKEGEELRKLASQLAQVVSRIQGEQDSSPAARHGAVDFTEQDVEAFDLGGSGERPPVLAVDAPATEGRRQSLRLEARSAGGVWLAYPRTRSAGWDLSGQNCIQLTCRMEPPGADAPPGELRIRIGKGSGCIEYHARAEALQQCLRTWGTLTIPLEGRRGWTRVDVTELDLADVDWIEVHAWADKPGLRLWLGDLRFDSVDFPPVDPDVRAALWVLGIGGTITISGKNEEVKSLAELPKAPLEIRSVSLSSIKSVTDDALENLAGITQCQSLNLRGTEVTDEGLIHLKGLSELSSLFLLDNDNISGRGIKYLEGLTKLTTLSIAGWANDEGMRSIGHLSWINNLTVRSYGEVTDEGFRHLERMTELRSLMLMGSDITDASFAHMAKFRRLNNLTVPAARVIGHGLVHLQGLPITQFNVQVQEIDERVIGALESLPNLNDLSLGAPTITEDNVRRVAGLKGLVSLGLSASRLSDVSLRHLSELTNLKNLSLNGVQLSDTAISHLSALKSLGQLQLNVTVERTQDAEAKLRAALPKCAISLDGKAVE